MSVAEMSQDAMSQNPIFCAKKICKHRKDHRRGRRKDISGYIIRWSTARVNLTKPTYYGA